MKTAFIFPGQGAQSVGMLADIANEYSIIKETFNTASEALGYDLWELVQNGPEGKLSETHITQPSLLTASYALWQLLQEHTELQADYVAGHSLGEYSALVAAEAIRFEDAVKLVEKRGQYMQEAVPAGKGAMAAIIGLEDDKVKEACNSAAEAGVVEPVNYNSPGQLVIAGEHVAVEQAIENCNALGALKAVQLAVSGPFHSQLMKPAAEKFEQALKSIEFSQPKITLVNNVDVEAPQDVDAIKSALVRQLYSPVRWTETIQYLDQQGVETTIECGPGKVLSGLNRRIVRKMAVNPIGELKGLQKLLNR